MFSLIGKVFGGGGGGGGREGEGGAATIHKPRGRPEEHVSADDAADGAAVAFIKAAVADGAEEDAAHPMYEEGLRLLAQLRPYLLGGPEEDDGGVTAAKTAATVGSEEGGAPVKKRGRPRKSDTVEMAIAGAKAAITPAALAGQAQRLRRVGAELQPLQPNQQQQHLNYSAGYGIGVTSPELQAVKNQLRPTGRQEEAVAVPPKRASTGGGWRGKRKSVEKQENREAEEGPVQKKRSGTAPFASPELKAARTKLRTTAAATDDATTVTTTRGRGRRRSAATDQLEEDKQAEEEQQQPKSGGRRRSGRASQTPSKPAAAAKRGKAAVAAANAMEEGDDGDPSAAVFASPEPARRTRRSTRLGW